VTELVRETLPGGEEDPQPRHQTAWETHLEAGDQMLLAVAGEGGVGKTRVIKVVELGFELLRRKDEVILLAPPPTTSVGVPSTPS
jgi:hypothetical protein